jgi:hypothetical protein
VGSEGTVIGVWCVRVRLRWVYGNTSHCRRCDMAWVIRTDFLRDVFKRDQRSNELLYFLINGKLPCTGFA